MIVTKKNFFKISLNPCIFSCCLAVLAQSDQALSFNSPSSVTGTMDETRERQQKGALEGFDAWKQKPSENLQRNLQGQALHFTSAQS